MKCYILVAFLIFAESADIRVRNKRADYGQILNGVTCDADHKCPFGYACRYISTLPGSLACVLMDPSVMTTTARRPGRCPNSGSFNPSGLQRCNNHEDCPEGIRCCPTAFASPAYCVVPQTVSSTPTVTPIIVGGGGQVGSNFDFVGASTLVQNKGYNILVDTSSMRVDLLRNLFQKAGLVQQDIDMVVTTHGHPDHYAYVGLFPNSEHVENTFTYNGHIYRPNPLGRGQPYFVNGDLNVEIKQTPGHTEADVTVVVKGTNFGTVSITGDLFLAENDVGDSFAIDKAKSDANRKLIACLSDYIVPGHGKMFKVTKANFGC